MTWTLNHRFLGLFSYKSKSAQFEWSFEWQYFGPCVRKITSWCVIWIAQFKWRSGPSFELRNSIYESRCNFAYTRSKIQSFEWSFKLRNSNDHSNCALLLSCKNGLRHIRTLHPKIFHFISLIPRLSHRLSYLTFRTISWSWNSSTNYFMARAFLRIHFHNTHESYVCRAKCRVCGTVKSELGQWVRINIGCARLKRNLDLISVFHCQCPRAQLLAAHTKLA